jgi:hypothetical protein
MVDVSDGRELSQLYRGPSPMPIGGLLVSVGRVQDHLLREWNARGMRDDG